MFNKKLKDRVEELENELIGEIEKINRKIELFEDMLLNANLGDIELIKDYLGIEKKPRGSEMVKKS